MDVVIPALLLTVAGYGVYDHVTTPEKAIPIAVQDVSQKENPEYADYIKRNAEKPELIVNTKKEPYANTTIINNPGFKPVINNLYFFKNYYQLNVRQYKVENSKVINGANINMTVDSPKIINFQDGYQFEYEKANYFDGIIIRAQLLPLSDQENKFRIIYEIESTKTTIKKNNFVEKSGNPVLEELVSENVTEKTSYQVIQNGFNVYNERVYSIDEKIIDINKPYYIDIGPYRMELNLLKGKESDLYYKPENINCKNKACEVMKENTLQKKRTSKK